jgi:hypothetical protein
MTTKSEMMATPRRKCPTGVNEGIRTPIGGGDTVIQGARRITAGSTMVGIPLMICAAPAITTAIAPLELCDNGKRLSSWGLEALKGPH